MGEYKIIAQIIHLLMQMGVWKDLLCWL